MKNEIGFAKRYEPAPSYYKKCFDAWCAVYFDDDDTEYHLQLCLDPWEWQHGNAVARGCEVLKQFPTHRLSMTGARVGKGVNGFPSIKKAHEFLKGLLTKESTK